MDSLIHERFREQVRKTPAGVALLHGDEAITFADLDAQVERSASALLHRGIGEGAVVGLHVDRSIPWVVGLLAILRANAAALPLPPSYPPGRLREILSFARLDAVVDHASSPLESSLVDPIWSLEVLGSYDGPLLTPPPGRADQPAFVLCSSGSTGRQKMIVRSHGSFFHRLDWTWTRHPYAPGELCCQKAHVTTTHSIYELFEPLLQGVPVVILPTEEVRDLERFWETLRRRSVSRLLIVPSALRASLDMPGFVPPELRVLVLMGEYVHPELAERAVAAFPATTRLYSIYGSTEASSTLVCDLREAFRPDAELPLGTPISEDVQALVLGPDLEPVERGEAGRLYMAGSALFTEYFRSADLTEDVVVRRPGTAERLYDTRDQVRLTADGALHYIGRVDHTVKIRGFRVNTQEVEGVIQGHPEVASCAVVVSGGEADNASLLAFVTPASVDRSSVYETLRNRLPDYMVPTALVPVETLPLTPSGKVDRARLLEEWGSASRDVPAGQVPSGPEATVRDAWARTLGHGDFALDSSFFEVGGTSLTIFTLVRHLRTAFALSPSQLGAESVYRFPTVGELAKHIAGVTSGVVGAAGLPVPLLVPLRKGRDAEKAPLFVIASAGGTLGAYEKLAKALQTPRDILGVQDPYLWGQRDPTEGFQLWVGRYLDAIRERQPAGPYYLGAYSSAGAFGYEIARRLRRAGEEVALLVLVDPLAMDRRSRRRFGYWALAATYMRPAVRRIVRMAGWIRGPLVRLLSRPGRPQAENDFRFSPANISEITDQTVRNRSHLISVATLLELNTGLPFALDVADFSESGPEGYLDVLEARVASLMPELDPERIERITIQYELQVRSQHAYELLPYDGPVLLVEPKSPYAGLVATQLRPFVRNLRARIVKLGAPSERERELSKTFGNLGAHYRSMRDDEFVRGLAAELDSLLG